MNRLVLAIAMLAIMVAPVSAQGFYRAASDFQNPRVVGGEINYDGSVLLGTGFKARLITTGEYEIVFQQGLFLNACPVMNVTGVGLGNDAPTPEVSQESSCSRTFYVRLFANSGFNNHTFQFVAVGTTGQ